MLSINKMLCFDKIELSVNSGAYQRLGSFSVLRTLTIDCSYQVKFLELLSIHALIKYLLATNLCRNHDTVFGV
jgi:hypothetical protein